MQVIKKKWVYFIFLIGLNCYTYTYDWLTSYLIIWKEWEKDKLEFIVRLFSKKIDLENWILLYTFVNLYLC